MAIEKIMSHMLPPNFFQGNESSLRFENQLPIVCWSALSVPPFDMSFFLLCRFRRNVFHFFYEMASLWLLPGKQMHILLQFAADFFMPEISSQKYTAGEVTLRIEHPVDLKTLQNNLPIFEREIRLGIESAYLAGRILEFKGLSANEKITLIQDSIVSLMHKRPQDFDYGLLSEMQHFLVLCRDEFKAARHCRHLSKIICVHYLFRKAMKLSLETFPDRRYISVKLIRAKLAGKKRVLGIALGISFIRQNEILEHPHILSAIKAIVPNAKKVADSFLKHLIGSEQAWTLYIEIEKEDETTFTLEEERQLKEKLPSEMKNHFQERLNPLFMPQNEEEIMRHILTLSGELTLVRDLPQVMILFNQQLVESLEFLVIVLRIFKPELKSISQLFESKSTPLEFLHDRTKYVGCLRKKYKKEAAVFRLRFHKAPFLRSDHSIDLYRARQELVKELSRLMGEFRDFNGGIISKETELFDKIRQDLGTLAKEHDLLLENFFFSLNPPLMRSLLPSDPIKNMFIMLLEAQEEGLANDQPYQIRIREKDGYFYLYLSAKEPSFYEILAPAIEGMESTSLQIASSFMPQTEIPSSFALISKISYPEEIGRLRLLIEQTMAGWAQRLFSLR